MIEAITRDVCACTSWPEMASDLRKLCSPGRSRTYVANPDSKSGGPCRQTNRGMWGLGYWPHSPSAQSGGPEEAASNVAEPVDQRSRAGRSPGKFSGGRLSTPRLPMPNCASTPASTEPHSPGPSWASGKAASNASELSAGMSICRGCGLGMTLRSTCLRRTPANSQAFATAAESPPSSSTRPRSQASAPVQTRPLATACRSAKPMPRSAAALVVKSS